MKLHGLKVILLALSLYPVFAGAHGGMSSSGGGEILTVARNPWFIGLDPVTVCVEVDPSSSISQNEAQNQIKEVIDDWVKTLAVRPPNPVAGATISSNFIFETCGASTDLKVLVGVFDQRLEQLWKAGSLSSLVAFAEQRSYDYKTKRAKGVVWIAPDGGPRAEKNQFPIYGNRTGFWSQSYTFWNVALHEIGHVFGFQHEDAWYGSPMGSKVPAASVEFSALLAQMAIPRYSSRSILFKTWMNDTRKVCGKVAFPEGFPLLSLQAGDGRKYERVCVQKAPMSLVDIQRVDVAIDLQDRGGSSETLKLSGRGNPANFGDTNNLIGHFPTGPNDISSIYHCFMSLSHRVQVQGTLTRGTSSSPAIMMDLESAGMMQILISDGKKFYPMLFRLTDFAPSVPPF